MKTTQVEQVPLLWGQTVCENYSRGLTLPDSVSEKITSDDQSPLIRRQVVWRNYSEQFTEKQNSVKTCTNSPKKGNLSYMEVDEKKERLSVENGYESVKII